MIKFLFLILCAPLFVISLEYHVKTVDDLHLALAIVRPGDGIVLVNDEPEVIHFYDQFVFDVNGTANLPITFQGHPNVIFNHTNKPDDSWGYTILVSGDYWIISDLKINYDTFVDGSTAIFVNGSYNKFLNTELYNSFRGISIFGSNNQFTNTVLSNCIKQGIQCWGDNTNFDVGEMNKCDMNFHGANDITIRNIYFTMPNESLHIFAQSTERITIRGNHFTRYPNQTFSYYLGAITLGMATGAINLSPLIENNVFIDVDEDPSPGFDTKPHIYFGEVKNGIIRNNTFTIKSSHGILLGNATSETIIMNNQFEAEWGNSSSNIFILGQPQLHMFNTIITCDNTFQNGLASNIWDSLLR